MPRSIFLLVPGLAWKLEFLEAPYIYSDANLRQVVRLYPFFVSKQKNEANQILAKYNAPATPIQQSFLVFMGAFWRDEFQPCIHNVLSLRSPYGMLRA